MGSKRIQMRKICALACGVVVLLSQVTVFGATGMNVEEHTKEEIMEYLKGMKETTLAYETKPVFPTSAGTLKPECLDSALATLNSVRYIAGIPYDVKLDASYNQLAQAAAYVDFLNNELSHYPGKVKGLDEKLYSLGAEGASSSNIAWGSWTKASLDDIIINQWMADEDASNIPRVGHRRWALNPSMKKTGFGGVWSNQKGTYTAMYAHDNSFGATSYYGVAWPAQNMPLSYFDESFPWSISMGRELGKDIMVELTRLSDNKIWSFQKGSKDFYINNDYYGQKGCIIFRPSGVSYKDGDSYNVRITGSGLDIDYDVNFFAAQKITSIKLSYYEKKVRVGSYLYLDAKVLPNKADESYKWKSSNKKIATVDKYGRVKGKKAGKVKITCVSDSGTVKDSITIKVTKK